MGGCRLVKSPRTMNVIIDFDSGSGLDWSVLTVVSDSGSGLDYPSYQELRISEKLSN